IHLGTHAIHLVLHVVLPAVVAPAGPAADLLVADRDAKKDQPDRPPEDEAEDRRDDPARVPVPVGPAVPGALPVGALAVAARGRVLSRIAHRNPPRLGLT